MKSNPYESTLIYKKKDYKKKCKQTFCYNDVLNKFIAHFETS